MPAYFVDSSALVKRYVRELGSTWIAEITGDTLNDIYIARLTGVEVTSTLVRRVASALALRQLERFRTDFVSSYVVINLTTPHFDSAMSLAEKHHLRGADALQLAVAVDTARIIGTIPMFVAADLELLHAASAEGFAIANPDEHA